MPLFRVVPLIKTVWKLTSSLIGVNRQHDIAVFHKLDITLDEPRIEKILKYSFFTECLRIEERELLHKFVDALQCVENRYLHPVLERRARQLAWEMSQLLQTVHSTFRSADGEIVRFCRDQKDPTAYDREWDKLHDEIEKTWKAYKAYKQVVKDRLKV